MRILSATDFLPKSEAAIERAGFLADALDAQLTLLHAVAPAIPDGNALEERVRRAGTRLAARTAPPNWRWKAQPQLTVQCGHPARVLQDNAERHDVQLVVLGPHGANTIADAVHGTTMEKLLGAARCPLLIARKHTVGRYRRVLVALDESPNAPAIVRTVSALGLARNSFATVVHAHEPLYVGMMSTVGVGMDATLSYVQASRAQATAGIRAILDAHSDPADRYRIMIVERRPATAILETVERVDPDLVVLGTRGFGRFRRALLGSVANDVLRGAQCDVLLVPQGAVRRTAELRPS